MFNGITVCGSLVLEDLEKNFEFLRNDGPEE